MLSYYNIAGVKIRYDSTDPVTEEAALFFNTPPMEDIDLDISENRMSRLIIPKDFLMTYEQEHQLQCFVSPSGELIIQMGLNRVDDTRDGSYRARFSADMSKVDVDYTPYLSNDAISGTLGRFIYECYSMNVGRLPLHAVSVNTGDGAILFSGVSGAGKSTQADLWIKYANSSIINGDRAIIIPENESFVTAGTAWSGTSEIYTKMCEEVKAIVFISQAKENTIEKLSQKHAFNNLVKHCAMPYYHSGLLNKVMDTIDSLTRTIPMYFLRNLADKECYNITKNAIFNG